MKSDNLAERTLKQLGFDVKKLPVSTESGKKMPDFLVRRGAFSALVEAKLKESDSDESRRRNEILDAGEVYVSDHVLGRDETLSGIVRQGAKQLNADTGIEFDFKIFLILAACINAHVVCEQFVDTLYGRTTVFELGKILRAKPCYFYRNSDFFRRKEIDAAIVGYVHELSGHASLKICLNPYSPRFQQIKASDFLRPFDGTVLDPIEEEKAGRAYIPDDDVERKEQPFTQAFPLYDPVLHHLVNKYQTGLLMRGDFNAPELVIRSR